MNADGGPRTPHGLVIGKCYPPHAGHEVLVRAAAAASERVTVLVLAHDVETLPLELRVAWLAETVADLPHVTVHGADDPHPVDFDDPAIWDLHVAEFRRAIAEVTDVPVTAVFSSEDYGDELARRFGAVHVAVDPDRSQAPISGTRVRADPAGSWHLLPPPVQAGLARRVVVIGAESTGTTTVADGLSAALQARGGPFAATRWVPEYGRERTAAKLAELRAEARATGRPKPTMAELDWPTSEFVHIARTQNALEDEAARAGGPVLVCDTDAFATGIWHERYRGEPSAEVDALARPHPLYLVTHHDGVPFVQDGLRDGEHVRAWMTDRFLDALATTGRTHVVLRGSADERVAAALEAVERDLATAWSFADPLTAPTPDP